jgi:hypothetical protein
MIATAPTKATAGAAGETHMTESEILGMELSADLTAQFCDRCLSTVAPDHVSSLLVLESAIPLAPRCPLHRTNCVLQAKV